jgi:RecB family exonuclease
MKYNLPKPYLSASSINTMLRCPMQFKFRYIDNIILPPNVNMLSGSAVHKSNEFYYEDVIKGYAERMTPKMVGELTQAMMEDMAKEQEYVLAGTEKDQTMAELKNISEAYIENIGQYVTPLAVEEEIRYTSRCGVDILGFIDLSRAPNELEADKNIDAVLVDYKITGKKWNGTKLKNSLQFHLYALSTGVMDIEVQNIVRTDKPIKKLPLKADPKDECKLDVTSNLRLLHHQFKESDFDHVENLIEGVAGMISAGIFIPCDMDAWCCNSTWCGYWGLCRGKSEAPPVIVDMAGAA